MDEKIMHSMERVADCADALDRLSGVLGDYTARCDGLTRTLDGFSDSGADAAQTAEETAAALTEELTALRKELHTLNSQLKKTDKLLCSSLPESWKDEFRGLLEQAQAAQMEQFARTLTAQTEQFAQTLSARTEQFAQTLAAAEERLLQANDSNLSLEALLKRHGPPLLLERENWYNDYVFLASYVQDDTVFGEVYQAGNFLYNQSYRITETGFHLYTGPTREAILSFHQNPAARQNLPPYQNPAARQNLPPYQNPAAYQYPAATFEKFDPPDANDLPY